MPGQKQVTIDAPSPTSGRSSSSREMNSTPNGDTTSRRGMIPVPNHMLSPGQDGYRTPTIEDYELHNCRPAPPYRDTGLPNNTMHLEVPSSPNGYINRHSLNLSSSSLGHSVLEKLQWRERIRHYTWTFFTMTMATGGLANVLHEGI